MATDALRIVTGIFISIILLVLGWDLRVKPKLKIVGWMLVALSVLGLIVILRFIANY
jgi:uncharacterized membrane protein